MKIFVQLFPLKYSPLALKYILELCFCNYRNPDLHGVSTGNTKELSVKKQYVVNY